MAEQKKKPDEELPFEAAMERLEKIVDQMEGEKLPLDQLLAKYEEGVKLVAQCNDKLDAAAKRVKVVARDRLGNEVLEEFGSADDDKQT